MFPAGHTFYLFLSNRGVAMARANAGTAVIPSDKRVSNRQFYPARRVVYS